ncbi:MAG TPA: DUF2061 domain-containing protein [Polyangiaceae bacterium]
MAATHRESARRSILKAASWRILGTLITTAFVCATTGRPLLALSIGGAEGLLKIVFFFLHERAWNLVDVGREDLPAMVPARSATRASRWIVEDRDAGVHAS